MTEERRKEVVEYVNTCMTCGKVFVVPHKDSKQELCYSCREKAAIARTQEELAGFVGATITRIEPDDSDEVKCIEVKTIDGKCIRFAPCDEYDGCYIEWTERGVP